MTWMPKRRSVYYAEKPPEIPDAVYQQALVAKRAYNENWEFWVWQVSIQDNVPLNVAEDACIRGIKKEVLRHKFIYGDKIGEWFERFLDLGDIFNKVKHPDYIARLGD